MALKGNFVTSEKQLTYIDMPMHWYMVNEPAYGIDREIIGISYNATDITERIKQKQLLYSQKESLRKIAFIQSHELRRPVSTIQGLMD